MLPPELAWKGVGILGLFALSIFFNGFMLIHLLSHDLAHFRTVWRKSPLRLVPALCAAFLAIKAGLIIQIGAYQFPQVMKIYFISTSALIVFNFTYLVLLSSYGLYLMMRRKFGCQF